MEADRRVLDQPSLFGEANHVHDCCRVTVQVALALFATLLSNEPAGFCRESESGQVLFL